MYIPKIYQENNITSIEAYIRENNFATLVGILDGVPVASHIPLLLNKGAEQLMGHVARPNILRQCFNGSQELMAIFMQTHAYVSSSWYDHVNVPTWNYISIHIYGRATILEGDELKNSIEELVDFHEGDRPDRFQMKDMDDEMLHAHLGGLTGFTMSIDRVEASFKLSQNRHDQDYENIIRQLESTDDQLSHRVAREMKNRRSQ